MIRFWSKVDKYGPDGFHSQTGENLGPCWIWTAGKNLRGYGTFMVGSRALGNRRPHLAHRLAYEEIIGSIGAGRELDHLCRVHACVNPKHLDPVTHAVNMARGAWRMKDRCPRGHAYDEANTRFTVRGGRKCRACHRDWENARYRAS